MLILAGVGAGPSGDFQSIATTTVGSGGSSTITFSSIPSTYKHLQVRYIARATNTEYIGLQMNSDTGSNYSFHSLSGNGATAYGNGGASRANIIMNLYTGTSTTANIFNAGVLDILDYANTNKYTTARALTGCDFNGSGAIELMSGSWLNTAAVTTLTFYRPIGGNFEQYTQFALYGIKG